MQRNIQSFGKSGIPFTKFVSNDRCILKSLPQDDLLTNCQAVNLNFDKTSLGRALGILWNPDNNTIKVRAITKSFLLSKRGLSSVFDLLGLLTLSILEEKLLLQQPWKNFLD